MPALQTDSDRTTLNVSLPLTLANRLSRLAVERGETRSQLIRRAVEAVYFSGVVQQSQGGASTAVLKERGA